MTLSCKRIGLILAKDNLSKEAGSNINGPCCVKVPEWCPNRLGRYYLYFAHHTGKYIRMAYSNSVHGPWREYDKGILNIKDLKDAFDHVASPDVLIDEDKKVINMYFHSPSRKKQQQWSYLATSKDGLDFRQTVDFPLAPFYLRVLKMEKNFIGMSKGGNIWESDTGCQEFRHVVNPFNVRLNSEIWHNSPGSIRHVALFKRRNFIYIFFSRIGDAPEGILYGEMEIDKPMPEWRVENISPLIEPEMDYEGVGLEVKPSYAGAAENEERALRDPYIFQDGEKIYMFYCVKGEHGIALSEIRLDD